MSDMQQQIINQKPDTTMNHRSILSTAAALLLAAASLNTHVQGWETLLDKSANLVTSDQEGHSIFVDPWSSDPALPNLFTGGLGEGGNVLLLDQTVPSLPNNYVVSDSQRGRSFQVARVPAASGNLYSVGSLFNGNPSSSWQVRRSTDGGASWSPFDLYQLAAGGNASASGVVADGAGNIYVAGSAFGTDGYEHWIVRKSASGSVAWTTFLNLSSRRANCAANGILYVPGKGLFVVGRVADKWTVQRKRDTDNSFTTVNTWTAVNKPNYVSLATGIAADAAGNIFVCGATGTTWEPRAWVVRMSTDGGNTWTTILGPWAPEGPGQLGIANSVTVDISGDVWLAGWNRADSFSNWDWTVARLDRATGWTLSADQPFVGARYGSPNGITTDADGNLYVAGSLRADNNSPMRWIVQRLVR